MLSGNQSPRDRQDAILRGRILPGMTFRERVWAMTSRVPRGKVTTYGQLAAALNSRSARAVGQALHCNPYAPHVPCHRVVGSTGQLTGYARGLPAKARLLKQEGIPINRDHVCDLAASLCSADLFMD